MNSEKVISNIKKAIKEHLDNNYAYDMLVDFELDVIDWNSLFEYIDKLQQENKELKDNWNKLKEWVNKQYDYYISEEDYIGGRLCFTDMKDKMQEIEKRK